MLSSALHCLIYSTCVRSHQRKYCAATTESAASRVARPQFFFATAILLVTPWQLEHWRTTAWSLAGIVGAIIVLGAAAALTLVLLYRLRGTLSWRFGYGIANLRRRLNLTVTQICALMLGLVALFLLSIIRNDLVDSWKNKLPDDAPNYFLINIQSDEKDQVARFLEQQFGRTPGLYPMTRARLTAINGAAVDLDNYQDPRARRLASRAFNLSASNSLKPDNAIIDGAYWQPGATTDAFSVEQGIAETLGIRVGDELHFSSEDRDIVAPVRNLRSVQWDTMQVNFFVEATPDLLADFSSTYIASLFITEQDEIHLKQLIADYPSVTVIDVGAILIHLRAIVERASSTIEFVFFFTIGAGLLVLIAATQATQNERIFESALLKALGSGRRQIIGLMTVEFLISGALAGAGAALAAQLSASIVAREVFELPYSFDPLMLITGAVIGVLMVAAVGIAALLAAYRRPATEVLRYD